MSEGKWEHCKTETYKVEWLRKYKSDCEAIREEWRKDEPKRHAEDLERRKGIRKKQEKEKQEKEKDADNLSLADRLRMHFK